MDLVVQFIVFCPHASRCYMRCRFPHGRQPSIGLSKVGYKRPSEDKPSAEGVPPTPIGEKGCEQSPAAGAPARAKEDPAKEDGGATPDFRKESDDESEASAAEAPAKDDPAEEVATPTGEKEDEEAAALEVAAKEDRAKEAGHGPGDKEKGAGLGPGHEERAGVGGRARKRAAPDATDGMANVKASSKATKATRGANAGAEVAGGRKRAPKRPATDASAAAAAASTGEGLSKWMKPAPGDFSGSEEF